MEGCVFCLYFGGRRRFVEETGRGVFSDSVVGIVFSIEISESFIRSSGVII